MKIRSLIVINASSSAAANARCSSGPCNQRGHTILQGAKRARQGSYQFLVFPFLIVSNPMPSLVRFEMYAPMSTPISGPT
jgi:hypothetical protein